MADPTYACSFAAGQWQATDWLLVKSPRWAWEGAWLQESDHIRNRVPVDASLSELQGARCGETYVSMLYRLPQTALRVRAEMSFDQRMAPLVVLAPEPVQNAAGQLEYREHIEVVLFDEGINVWHHQWSAERGPYWNRAAWARFRAAVGRRYVLEVERAGAQLVVRCAGHAFGVALALPDRLYAGVTGCEGINRFYHFALWSEEE
jgi:hypothetical protein